MKKIRRKISRKMRRNQKKRNEKESPPFFFLLTLLIFPRSHIHQSDSTISSNYTFKVVEKTPP